MSDKRKVYTEPLRRAEPYRKAIVSQVDSLIAARQKECNRRRRNYFKPDFKGIPQYCDSIERYRDEYAAMLGWPLTEARPSKRPKARRKLVARDALGTIHRLWIETLPGLETYGLLFTPDGEGPFPLVISQHGGGGTPETASGVYPTENYNNMSRRVLARQAMVFAPQLLLWRTEHYGAPYQRVPVDTSLKQVGSSIAALEIYQLSRALDYLLGLRKVDSGRVGMIGLSYGGFFTQYTAAFDTRITAAASSCFFNNRTAYNWAADLGWFDAANTFLDGEVAALICPRHLFVEVGVQDNLFDYRKARPVMRQVRRIYEKLGISERFVYNEHPGSHELALTDESIDFLMAHM